MLSKLTSGVMVAQRFLAPFVGVRVPTGQPKRSPAGSGAFFWLEAVGDENPWVRPQKLRSKLLWRINAKHLPEGREQRGFCEAKPSGSTPKRVDINERRRIEPRPSICNFQSFYNRKPFAV